MLLYEAIINVRKFGFFSNVELDCTLNQSRVEEITLQEEPMKVNSLEDYFDDEGFGDMDVDGTG